MTPVAAIVLAAGRSTRMGGANKLLLDLDGEPLIRRTVETVLASRARPVLVVTGHAGDAVARALAGLPVTLVPNPDHAAGLSTSLKAGLAAVPADCGAALVALGDMPFVRADTIDRLIAAYAPGGIVLPVHQGRRGHPVLWDRAFFAEMSGLTGDTGARSLLVGHAHRLREIAVDDSGILSDVDTPEDAVILTRRLTDM